MKNIVLIGIAALSALVMCSCSTVQVTDAYSIPPHTNVVFSTSSATGSITRITFDPSKLGISGNDAITGWVVYDAVPDLPDPVIPDRHANSVTFLRDGASPPRGRVMNSCSENMSDADYTRILNDSVAAGDDTIALYLANLRDGAPVPTSFYSGGGYGGPVDKGRVSFIVKRIEQAKARGLKVHLWCWADDSGFGVSVLRLFGMAAPSILSYPRGTHEEHLRHCVTLFGGLADAFCVGLELDEYFSDNDVVYFTTYLKGLTDKPVGVHFTSVNRTDLAIASGADIFFGQYGFGKTPGQILNETRQAVQRLSGTGVEYWAWEYHKSSLTESARTLGDAAYSVEGCIGTGNGRNVR